MVRFRFIQKKQGGLKLLLMTVVLVVLVFWPGVYVILVLLWPDVHIVLL